METLAYAALILVVPASALAFATLKPHLAAVGTIVFAVLYLPQQVSYDLPVLPALDKLSIPPLLALVGLLFAGGRRWTTARLGGLLDWIAVLMLGSVFLSNILATQALVYGPLVLPPMRLTDALSHTLRWALTYVMPYFVGRICCQDSRDAKDILTLLVVAALSYLPLMLFELRMAPTLHYRIYGIQPHMFLQSLRAGGYRPMVFMGHGLALAIFIYAALVASWTLYKARVRVLGFSSLLISVVLSIAMVLMKSMGSLLFACVAVPLGLFTSTRTQGKVLVVVCTIVALFPLMRSRGWFPTDWLVTNIEHYNPDRAQSLEFRFDNEDILLEKATKKPILGWGSAGRARVYDADGKDVAITDGDWIILLGGQGYVGFALQFGLFIGSVLAARSAARSLRRPEAALIYGFAWIVTLSAADLLPNGLFNTLLLLICGCLAGLSTGMPREARLARKRRRAEQQAAWSNANHPPVARIP